VQGALYAGPVVIAEAADAGGHVLDVLLADFGGAQSHLSIYETGLRHAAQVQDYFQQLFLLVQILQGVT
jgi:hypothetical protein